MRLHAHAVTRNYTAVTYSYIAVTVSYMRLHVFIVRREYNEASGEWSLVRNELTMRDQDYWNATLKFVQTF